MHVSRIVFAPWFLLGLLTFLVHVFANGGYGIFRDELYFIVCGRHPAWGYVDQPPLVPLIAAWSYALSGDWLTGFRLVPAVVMAVTVGFTAEFTRALGGRRFSQWLAGLTTLACPVLLTFGMLVSTNMFEPLGYLLVSYFLLRLAQSQDERWWLAVALAAAACFWSKYGIVFYAGALGLAILLTPLRRSFAKPWIYIAAVTGVVLVLPNILWQAQHHWPFFELGYAASHGKNKELSVLEFFGQQVLTMGPLLALIWLPGLWRLARHPVGRAFAIAYALLAAFYIVGHGKAYYLAPLYPLLFAGGAVFWEEMTRRAMPRIALVFAVLLMGIVAAPMALPVLPVETYFAYAKALHYDSSKTEGEKLKTGRLPQLFADMHGWREMGEKVAAIYLALPPAERARAAFFGSDYGQAAAVDVYAGEYGVPAAISGHNQYWVWGPRHADGSVIIEIGGTREEHLEDFASVEKAGELDAPYAMPYETNKPIWVERGLKRPLGEIWPKVKHFE